jgi:predicted MFS family arabinose efflux permease
MLALLRRRDFALVWTGGLVSMAGDWILYAALPYHVFATTGSTLATAAMVAGELLPNLLLTSFAGVLVDRWDRKRVMVATSLLQALAVLALAMLNGVAGIVVAFAVVTVLAALSTLFGPAENALLPRLVEPNQLVAANGMNALNNNLARLVGAPVGGLALALWGIEGVAFLDALTFTVGALLIAAIRTSGRVGADAADSEAVHEPAFWHEWREGLAIIVRRRELSALFAVLLLMNFGGVMTDPLYAPFVRDVVGAGPQAFGWLLTVRGLGGICGGFVAGWVGARFPTVTLLSAGCVISGILLQIQFHVPLLPVVMALAFVGGIPAVVSASSVQALLQQTVPERFMGRVYGALSTGVATVSLVSVLGFGGLLASLFGIVPVLTFAAGVTLGVGVVARLTLQRSTSDGPDKAT